MDQCPSRLGPPLGGADPIPLPPRPSQVTLSCPLADVTEDEKVAGSRLGFC